MKRTLLSTRFLAVVAAATLAACSDASEQQLAPQPAALSASLLPRIVASVSRGTPLDADVVTSATVTNAGGTITVPEAGLTLKVPANALPAGTSSMTIRVTAFKGSQYAYDFAPSGVVFRQPLSFEQQIDGLPIQALLGAHVGYFKSRADLNPAAGLATTYESLPLALDILGLKIRAKIWHFSGYIAEW